MRFVLFFLSCLSFFDCSGQTVQDYLRSGYEKYEQYQIKEAISDYRQALVLDSNNIAAYYALGEAESWRMSYDSAIYFYTKSIRMSDNSTYGLFNRGRTYYYKGDYEKALSDFDQLIGKEKLFVPLNAEVRAMIRFRAHQYYGAIDDLTKVINDRAYVQDLFLRARCYQHTNQDSLAHEDFAALIREEQQNNHVLYSAYAFYYSGKKEKALKMQADYVKDHGGKENYYRLAGLYALENNVPDAIQWLNMAFLNGFRKFGVLAQDESFDKIRDSEDYKQLLKKYLEPYF
jgi:tetratricopeptide (TPR) repeat protein